MSGEPPSSMMTSPGPGPGTPQPSPLSHPAASPAPHTHPNPNAGSQQQQAPSPMAPPQPPSPMNHPQPSPSPMGPPMQQHPPPQFQQQPQQQLQQQQQQPYPPDPRYSALLAMRAKQGGMAPTSPSPGPPLEPKRQNVSSPYGPPNSGALNGNPSPQPLLEVSSERYYQTTKALDIGKGGEFSLRNLFKPTHDTLEEEDKYEEEFESPNLSVIPQEVVSKTYFKPEIGGKAEQQGYWKKAGMWHEPLIFLSGDVRFKEAMDFIHHTGKDETYQDRNKWSEQREKLKQFYRNKMRRHSQWVTESSQQPQRKRPLTDAADESSYNFYGQQDEIERQKKKKPHRPFFK